MKSASKTILLLALAFTGIYSCGKILTAPSSETAQETSPLEPVRISGDFGLAGWQPLDRYPLNEVPKPAPLVKPGQDGWQSLSVIGSIEDAAPGQVRQTALNDSDGFQPLANPFSNSRTSRRSVTNLPPVEPATQTTALPPVESPSPTRSLPITRMAADTPSASVPTASSHRLSNPFAGQNAVTNPSTGQQEVTAQRDTAATSNIQPFQPPQTLTELSSTETSRMTKVRSLPTDDAAAMANAMAEALNQSMPNPVQLEDNDSFVPEIPNLQADTIATPETPASERVEMPAEIATNEDELPASPAFSGLPSWTAETTNQETQPMDLATEPQPVAKPVAEMQMQDPATATESAADMMEQTQDVASEFAPTTADELSQPAALVAQDATPEDTLVEVQAAPVMRVSPIVEQRAQERVAYGKSLARRGATFAARQEYVQALRLIADAYDVQSGSREYTARLASALRALGEADDFVARDTEQQLNMDMGMILETHSSRLIDPQLADQITPIQAMLTYYAYAQDEMSSAVAQSMAGSEALYALGKLLAATARSGGSANPVNGVKAMVMYQSALSANPQHYQSANELGVLMARNGQWQKAKNLFIQSLQTQQLPETWQNLATVHNRLGEAELASMASLESDKLQGVTPEGGGPGQWVTPQQFAENAAIAEEAPAARPVQTAQAVEAETEQEKPKGIFGSMKKLF